FSAIDLRPFDIAYRIHLDHIEFDEMCKETGECRETPAHGRGLTPLLFTHEPFPCHDCAMIHTAQLVCRLNVEGPHEVCDIVAIRPAGPGTLATRQPDLFFRNAGELVHRNPLDRRLS